MQNNALEPKYFFLGLILIFSGVLLFFGFFFSIFLFRNLITENPLNFIFSFFAMFFLIALIFIAGVFMIQKSAKNKNNDFRTSDKYEEARYDNKKEYFASEYIKKKINFNETNFCVGCGSEVLDADVFCLNCGNKI